MPGGLAQQVKQTNKKDEACPAVFAQDITKSIGVGQLYAYLIHKACGLTNAITLTDKKLRADKRINPWEVNCKILCLFIMIYL